MSSTDAVPAKPKRKYQRKNSPPPKATEHPLANPPAQPGNNEPAAHLTPLQQYIKTSLLLGNTKADVLAQAMVMNKQQASPLSADDVLAEVENQFSNLDSELSDEDLLFKLASEKITLVTHGLWVFVMVYDMDVLGGYGGVGIGEEIRDWQRV